MAETGRTVTVKRTLLPAPDLSDPTRKIYQIQYQVGELPPHFIYMPEKEWSAAKEADLIKADLNKRMSATPQTITI